MGYTKSKMVQDFMILDAIISINDVFTTPLANPMKIGKETRLSPDVIRKRLDFLGMGHYIKGYKSGDRRVSANYELTKRGNALLYYMMNHDKAGVGYPECLC
jgi:hypothetical protein